MNHHRSLLVHLPRLAAGMSACLAITACAPPPPKLVVSDPDPSVKIPAIKKAVRQKDLDACAQLVKDLESDDPAVRLFAIEGLERLTGERFGYDYYGPAEQRQAAVERWQQWLGQQPQP